MEIENLVTDSSDHRCRRGRTSLLRGYSLQEAPDLLIPALSCRRRSIEHTLGAVSARPVVATSSREILPTDDREIHEDMEMDDQLVIDIDQPPSPYAQTRRATISCGTGRNHFTRKQSSLRDWPYGEPNVRNGSEYVEMDFDAGPFKKEEISTKIVGKELIIHCKADMDIRQTGECIPKEIFRCYQLPLATDPTPSEVSILKDDQYIRIAIRKEAPLKSPSHLLFTPEISHILEEEHQSDVEQEVPDVVVDGHTNELD